MKRVMACPGSVLLSQECPPLPDSPASKEGTFAHKVFEHYLAPHVTVNNLAPHEKVKHYPKDMEEYCHWAVREVRALIEPGVESFSEQKIDISHFTAPGMFGTADAAIVELFDTLTIIDFKYGRMPVDVRNNVQLICYALGKLRLYDYNFLRCRMVILQPRAEHSDGPRREWIAPVDALLPWEEKIKHACDAALRKNAPRKGGPHCFFCPAQVICPEYVENLEWKDLVNEGDPNRKANTAIADFAGIEIEE